MEDIVHWNIKVSKKTDLALRIFLGSQGIKKGGLSKFIEEAVRAQALHCTVQEIKARNADTETLQVHMDNAVHDIRKNSAVGS